MIAYPEVLTWYAQGEAKPWRLAHRTPADGEGEWRGVVCSDTFAGLLNALADSWARLQPEPLDESGPQDAP